MKGQLKGQVSVKVTSERTSRSLVEMGQAKEIELLIVGETETKNTFTPTVNWYFTVRSVCPRHFVAMSVIMEELGSMLVV